MGNRSKAREYALGYHYQVECKVSSTTLDIGRFAQYFKLKEPVEDYLREIIEGVKDHQTEIDAEIEEVAENWRLSRMAKLDRCVLRIATWEVLYRPDIPERVVVDEAVELAKTFGDKNSSSFVNGIMDKIVQRNRSMKKTTA